MKEVSHAKTTLRFVLAAAELVCNGFQIDTLRPKILICRCSRWSLSRARAAARGPAEWRENQKFAIRSETSQFAAATARSHFRCEISTLVLENLIFEI